MKKFLSTPLRALFALLVVSAAVFCPVAKAGLLDGLLGLPSSGKVAKYDFSLKEDFPVTSIAWSPDGRYIADSSSHSSSINIWSVREKRVVQHFRFDGANPYFHALTFSPDSKWLAFCDGTATLRVYNTLDWSPAHIQDKPDGFCRTRVAFSDDAALLALDGKDLVVLDTKSWGIKKVIDHGWHEEKSVDIFVFSPKTHDLIIGGGDRFPDYPGQRNPPSGGALWALSQDENLPSIRISVYIPNKSSHFNSHVEALAISPNGKLLTTGARTGSGSPGYIISDAIRILDLSTHAVLASPLDGVFSAEQSAIDFSNDGRYIFVGEMGLKSSKIVLIDVSNFNVVDTIAAGASVYDVVSNPLGAGFAAAIGNRIVFWKFIKIRN